MKIVKIDIDELEVSIFNIMLHNDIYRKMSDYYVVEIAKKAIDKCTIKEKE